MQTDNKEWKSFSIGDLFSIGSGARLETRNKIQGTRPFIGATDNANGVTSFVANDNSSKDKNVLGVNYDGAPGIAFYHPYECIFTDSVKRLHLKSRKDSKWTSLFFVTIFFRQRSKYGYGYKFNARRMYRQLLMLPASKDGSPDFEYMEQHASSLGGGLLMQYIKFIAGRISLLEEKKIPSLDSKKWKAFPLEEVFTVSAGKRLETRNKKPGNRPFIGAADNSNGITGFVGNNNSSVDRNVLGVNYNGAPCIAFYHPYECLFTDDVKRLHLRNRSDNEFALLFFVPVFAKQRSKYSYGYKFNESRMLRQKLLLPVNDSGKPDFDYMEQYVKNLMLRKYRQYLSFLDRKSR